MPQEQQARQRRLPRLLLVTGMSGAGKSHVLDTLEDMGWDVVDNLPADLLQAFVNGDDRCRTASAAIAIDSRSRGFDPHRLPDLIRSVEGVEPEILYLDCSGTELIAATTRPGGAIRSRPTVRPRTALPANAQLTCRSATPPTASSTPPISAPPSCATSSSVATAVIPTSRC